MLFDAPGVTINTATVLMFVSIVCYPPLAFGSIVLAWVLYACALQRTTGVVSLLPAAVGQRVVLVGLGLRRTTGRLVSCSRPLARAAFSKPPENRS